MNAATEIGLQILAWLARQFVMGELLSSLERERDAAQSEAFVAFWLESLLAHIVLAESVLETEQPLIVSDEGLFYWYI